MSQQPKDQKDADLRRVDDAINSLIEHFDTVQVFVTRDESGELDGTVHISKGRGHWFARYGQVRTWVIQEDEASRRKVSAEDDSEL